jgi:hypothetical protein
LLAARKSAVGSDAVGVWDLDTGQAVATLGTGRVDHLALAADDRTCVAADGGTLRVWDLATGRERGQRPLPATATRLVLTPDGRRALTTLADGTGLVWDLTAFPAEPLSRAAGENEVAGWWADLASDDAGAAHAAAWRLADGPANVVVPVLARHLRPATIDAAAVRQAIANLDSASPADRDEATKRLERMGGAVVPALRQAGATTDSAEVRRRLEELIERLSGPVATPDGLRQLRAVGVLVRLGTADARKLLAELAQGAPAARLTQEAQAVLERLERREPVR